MSPPIFNPNGPEVSEIVLPNGATASEVIDPDGNVVFEAGPDIPDSDIYLQDDWGDNKLQNRDGSGTTTYNGVTGYYRPDYQIGGGPVAENNLLKIRTDDRVYHEINLDLSQTVTWTFDISNVSGGLDDQIGISLFAESSNFIDSSTYLDNSYSLHFFTTKETVLYEIDSGSKTDLIKGDDPSNVSSLTVTRQSDGTWELFTDGVSDGTGTSSTFTSPQYFAISGRSNANPEGDFNEYKVF